MVPQSSPTDPGLFTVDATWGKISPIELAPGVRTVGELEVIAHAKAGRPLVDTRLPHFVSAGTIPGAIGIPHEAILDQLDQLDREVETVFFCNGPQCGASPDAISAMLEARYPAERILYYRGGMHDWVTLGLPVSTSAAASSDIEGFQSRRADSNR